MNNTILELTNQQNQLLTQRNQLKYHADKEDDLLSSQFERVEIQLDQVQKSLRKAYNDLYVKR